jgi:hypothetical protein
MANRVSFEHITLAVSMFHPTTSNLAEHLDAMNDSAPGYTRTGTLNMCFMMDSPNKNFQVGLKLQVIGNFRRVIRQYMERMERTRSNLVPTVTAGSYADFFKQVNYQPMDRELQEVAYKFGQCLRNKDNVSNIIFEGRKSRISEGSQIYKNNYNQSNTTFIPYRFKVATFGDTEYALQQNIRQMKALGHMERSS